MQAKRCENIPRGSEIMMWDSKDQKWEGVDRKNLNN